MNKIVITILFCAFFCLNVQTEAKINDLILDFNQVKTNVKEKMPFKKKTPPPKPKMPETKQEWDIEAKNIPLEEREIKEEKQEIDKKFYTPETKYVFEAYNYPQGTRELNFESVKKDLFYYSYIIADKNFHYGAYSHYFYAPDSNQITSKFYVEKLDTTKNKTQRILDYRHKQKERIPVIEAGTKEIYPNLFNGLTLVDWSQDSKKLLIKEKIGSTQNGIYKTKLYIHFLEGEIENEYTIKLDDFDKTIQYYFLDWENKQIIKYRYDIIPLGFSAENDNIILAICYAYDNDGNKVFLGLWGYDCQKQETILISKTKTTPNVSINGFFLKRTID